MKNWKTCPTRKQFNKLLKQGRTKTLRRIEHDRTTKYVVTAFVKNEGERRIISIPLDLSSAKRFKLQKQYEEFIAIPKYKWATDIKLRKVIS